MSNFLGKIDEEIANKKSRFTGAQTRSVLLGVVAELGG